MGRAGSSRQLADQGLHGETGDDERGRPVQCAAEGAVEFRVGDGGGARGVDRAGDLGVGEREDDGADLVVEGDPREVLAAAAESSAQADEVQRLQLAEQAAVAGEHHGAADQHGADTRFGRRFGGGFPVPAQHGQEIRSGG